MKKYILSSTLIKGLMVLIFGIIWGGSWGQTTFSWRNDQNPTSGQWNVSSYWWNGSGAALPGGAEILFLDGSVGTTMTNDLPSTNRHKITFGSTNTPASRTINGSTTNTFFEFGLTWPRIQNDATNVIHTINFPFNASTNNTFNMELVANAGALIFGSSALINNNGRGIYIYGNNSTINATNRFVRLSGVVSGSGLLNVSQNGTVKLNATHTYTGQTQIDNGELWIETLGDAISSSSAIYVGNGGQLANVAKLFLAATSGGATFSRNINMNAGNASTRFLGGVNTSGTNIFSGTITGTNSDLNLEAVSGTGTIEFSGAISGSGAVRVIGAGTIILSGTNTFTGTTTVSAGTLQIGAGGTTGLISASSPIVNNSALVFNRTDNYGQSYSQNISGTGTLTLSGNGGTLTLTGANSFTGATTINSGSELRLNPSANANYTSQMVLNGGTLSTTGITATRTFTSSSTLNLNSSSTIALGTGNHTLTFANSSTVTWNGSTLTITGWGGTAGQTNTNGGKIFVGVGGLTSDQLAKISFSGYPGTPILLPSGELVPQSPLVTFSNSQFTVARNITRGTTEVPIYRFEVNVTGVYATLNSLSFTTPITAADGNSNYVNTDITNFKAFLTTSATFSTSTQLGSTSPSGKTQQNAGETLINFTSLATTLNVGTTYYIWLTADVLNGAVAGRKIVVNEPTIGITGSVSGINSATGVQTIEAVATNYYLNVGGNVTTSANYFTSPNGVGTTLSAAGLSNTSNDVILNIPISVTNTGDFTLGNGSKIVVQNGGSLTVGFANTITGTIDVNDGGTLTFNNTNISSTLGTLGSTSTIIYGASGAQAVTTKNYGNLTISGGNTKTISGAAAVSGNLTINGTVLALGSNSLTPNTLTLDGIGTKNGSWGSTAGSATYKNATYFGATGTGTVTPNSNTAATASFSNISTSQSINYGTASVSLSGKVASGAIYPANGETVSVTINGVAQTTSTTNGDGSFSINYTTSTLPVSASPYTITYAYTGNANGFLQTASNETSTTLTVNAATNNWIGGTGTWSTPANWSLSRVPNSLNDNITISSGTLTMDANYILGAGRTLTISGTGTLIISPSGSITIEGTADFGGKLVTVQSDNTGTGSIGTISGTLSNATNVTVQRFVSGAGRRWRFLSSPVTSATVANWMTQFYVTGPDDGTTTTSTPLGSAMPTTGWHCSKANQDYPNTNYPLAPSNVRSVKTTSIRTYNETVTGNNTNLNAGWENLIGTSQALTPGQGFRVFVRGAIGNTGQLNGTVSGQTEVTLALNGTVNQGNVTPTLTNNTQGWNLLGNPYASNYDWNAFYDNGTNLTNIAPTAYIFDATTNAYVSYNASSNGPASGTLALTGGIIPSGAAFFIQANGASPALTFKEAFKSTSSAIQLQKSAVSDEFGIKYSKDSIESDNLYIKILAGSTLNSEGFDIKKIRNENLNLAAYGEDTMNLYMSVIPPIVSETRIKLNVEATAIGTYNFDFKNMDNFQSNITVSLFDRYTNKTTDVRKNTKYTFDMGAGVNQWGNNRFELILNLDKTNVDEFALLNQTHMLVYPNPATDVLNINISNGSFKNSEVVVYNISGMEVLKTNMAVNNAQLNIESLSNGVYFVKVTNQNGFNKTVKFVK